MKSCKISKATLTAHTPAAHVKTARVNAVVAVPGALHICVSMILASISCNVTNLVVGAREMAVVAGVNSATATHTAEKGMLVVLRSLSAWVLALAVVASGHEAARL